MLRLLSVVLLIWSPLLSADAVRQLERFAEGLETLSGAFHQVIFDDEGFIVEESSGLLYFQAPDRFRWDYAEPFPQQLVADGERLWHFDEGLDQVTVRDQPPPSDSPLMVLTSPHLLERFYRVEDHDNPDVLRFLPLAPEAGFERALMRFADGVPVELELVDSLIGQITRIELQELVRNPELSADRFLFTPPPGVDVLEGY